MLLILDYYRYWICPNERCSYKKNYLNSLQCYQCHSNKPSRAEIFYLRKSEKISIRKNEPNTEIVEIYSPSLNLDENYTDKNLPSNYHINNHHSNKGGPKSLARLEIRDTIMKREMPYRKSDLINKSHRTVREDNAKYYRQSISDLPKLSPVSQDKSSKNSENEHQVIPDKTSSSTNSVIKYPSKSTMNLILSNFKVIETEFCYKDICEAIQFLKSKRKIEAD